MLLKEEEIKSHLRLDDGLYSDGDFLKLLAQAVQKRTETYLNRKLYAPEETIPEDDPDGMHLTDDVRLAMLMLVSHFYENRSTITDVEKLETPNEFQMACWPLQDCPTMKIRQSQTSATYLLPDPGELNRRIKIRLRVDEPTADFGTEPTYTESFDVWAKVAQPALPLIRAQCRQKISLRIILRSVSVTTSRQIMRWFITVRSTGSGEYAT